MCIYKRWFIKYNINSLWQLICPPIIRTHALLFIRETNKHKWNQCKNSRWESEGETLEEHCLLVCFKGQVWYLLCTSPAHLPKKQYFLYLLALSTSGSILKSFSDIPLGQIWWRHLVNCLSFSSVMSRCEARLQIIMDTYTKGYTHICM